MSVKKPRNRRAPPQRDGGVREVCLPLPLREFNRFKVGLRRILVPIDFSSGSKRALVYALPLARVFGGSITLVHVVEPVACVVNCGYGGVVREWPNEARMEYVRQRLFRFGQPFRRSGMTIDLEVRSGRPSSQIVETANELGTDLIVISTRGRGNQTGEAMGSTAEQIARLAPCPVLVVRERERDFVTLTRSRNVTRHDRRNPVRARRQATPA